MATVNYALAGTLAARVQDAHGKFTLSQVSSLWSSLNIPHAAPSGQSTLDADWAARSTAAGVFFAQNFNTSGPVTGNIWTNPNGTMAWQSAIKRSGAGAVRINKLAGDGADSGLLRMCLDGVNRGTTGQSSVMRGANTETWYQLSVYCDAAILRYKPTYTGGQGGFKVLWISGGISHSNTAQEVVSTNQMYRGHPIPYYDGNSFLDFSVGAVSPNDSSNFRLTPAIDAGTPLTPTTDSQYAQRYGALYHNRTPGYTLPNLGQYPDGGDIQAQGFPDPNVLASGLPAFTANGWTTLQFRIKLGADTGSSFSNCEVDLYAAQTGQPFKRIVQATGFSINHDPGDAHGAFWLSAYDTARIPNSPTIVDSFLVYTELIASSQPIAAPTVSGVVPTWLQNKTIGQWFTISGTTIAAAQSGFTAPGGSKSGITAYSGADVMGSKMLWEGGGHADYAGNEIYMLDLSQNAPAVARLNNPTASVYPSSDQGLAYYTDGRPVSRHSGWNVQGIVSRNRLMTFGSWAVWGNGNGAFPKVDGFNLSTNDYDAAGTYPDVPFTDNQPTMVAKDSSDNVWCQSVTTGQLCRWNQALNTWTNFGTKSNCENKTPFCWDPINSRMVRFSRTYGKYYDTSGNENTVTFTGPGAAAAIGSTSGECSVVWCNARNSFLIMPWRVTGAIYECTTSFVVTQLTLTGTPPSAPSQDGDQNTSGRFNYLPALGVCVYSRTTSDDLFVFLVGATSPTTFTDTFPSTLAHLAGGYVFGDNNGLNAATGPKVVGGTPGVTYGQAGDGVDYIATLPGRFTTTKHYSECIIKRTAGYTAPDTQECELLDLFTLANGVATGYEFDIWFGGAQCQPVRWDGIGSYNFSAVTTLSGTWPGNLVDGDVVRVSADTSSGSPVFTISVNGTTVLVMTDVTAGKIMSGSPGFGSFARTGTGFDPAKYAIKTWSAGNA